MDSEWDAIKGPVGVTASCPSTYVHVVFDVLMNSVSILYSDDLFLVFSRTELGAVVLTRPPVFMQVASDSAGRVSRMRGLTRSMTGPPWAPRTPRRGSRQDRARPLRILSTAWPLGSTLRPLTAARMTTRTAVTIMMPQTAPPGALRYCGCEGAQAGMIYIMWGLYQCPPP